jgi:hypothetical protein
MNDFENDILKMLQHVSKKEPFSNEFIDAVLLLATQVDPHAELKAQYARDVETCETIPSLESYQLWMWSGDCTKWHTCNARPDWADNAKWRRNPHADLMIEYHQCSDRDKNRWQVKGGDRNNWLNWTDCIVEPDWDEKSEYRLKPEVIVINGKEYNAPLRDSKGIKRDYVYFDFNGSDFFASVSKWDNDFCDNKRLNAGLIFASKEDCQAVADAFNEILRGDL